MAGAWLLTTTRARRAGPERIARILAARATGARALPQNSVSDPWGPFTF